MQMMVQTGIAGTVTLGGRRQRRHGSIFQYTTSPGRLCNWRNTHCVGSVRFMSRGSTFGGGTMFQEGQTFGGAERIVPMVGHRRRWWVPIGLLWRYAISTVFYHSIRKHGCGIVHGRIVHGHGIWRQSMILSSGLMRCFLRRDAHYIHSVMDRHIAAIMKFVATTQVATTEILTPHASTAGTAFDIGGVTFTVLLKDREDKKVRTTIFTQLKRNGRIYHMVVAGGATHLFHTRRFATFASQSMGQYARHFGRCDQGGGGGGDVRCRRRRGHDRGVGRGGGMIRIGSLGQVGGRRRRWTGRLCSRHWIRGRHDRLFHEYQCRILFEFRVKGG